MILITCRRMALIIVLTLSVFCRLHAQERYAGRWKNIGALENKGLYKTALGEVRQVYRQAKTAGDHPQQIRALIYEMKYVELLEEDALPGNIQRLAEEVAAAPVPEKEILESMLAELYGNYLQQHRYQLYSRTAVQDDRGTDIRTWSAERLNREIADHYRQSLTPASRLQEVSLRDYDPVIIRGKNTGGLRPTLYDLLANRALDYFTGEERNITQAADRFEIDDPRAFAPAAKFSGIKFHTPDTSSWSYKAIGIFQELIRFHLRDASPDALVDVDIRRLQWMYQKSVAENKDSLYLAALGTAQENYQQSPASAQAGYLAAELIYQRGGRYQPLTADTANRWDFKNAKERCEAVIKKFPKSEGGINCRSLLRSILQPQIGMQTEKVNIPSQPFRTLVTYKNIAKIYFRLVKVPSDENEKIGRWDDTAYWKKLAGLPSYDAWNLSFPDPGDYREHAAEIKVNALPAGNYALLASGDSSFQTVQNPLSFQLFYVSNISYTGDGQGNYFVLDRETGRPLAGVKVQLWENVYDYTTRTSAFQKEETYTTNADGHFKIAAGKDYRAARLEFTWQNDHLLTEDYQGIAMNTGLQSAEQEIKPKAFIFTDRSIYRPGQAIWFKGIVLKTNPQTSKSEVLPGFKTTVYLYDVNGQAVDSLPVTTNNWGSYAGSLTIPKSLLNGQMYLQDREGSGQAYFSVEEYKRPKFYVDLKTPAEALRLGDTVRITGSAMAYAGANMPGATVKYQVVRLARFPWYGRRYGPVRPSSAQMEITQGEATTNRNGQFTISFAAVPDRSIPQSLQPVFDYLVQADVTDINGETRSGKITIPVGYRSLQLSVNLPDRVAADSLKHISVTTAGLDGKFVPAEVTLSLYKLKAPGRLIRERYWPQPDQYVMNREKYLEYFPHDEYGDEADPATWARTDKVWQQSLTTAAESRFGTGSLQVAPGWYAVEATAKDKYGSAVKDVKYVQVFNDAMKALPFNVMAWGTALQSAVSPGGRADILVGTAAKDLYLVQQVERMKGAEKFSVLHLNDEVKKITVPVNEADRGGIAYHYFFVKDNRFYSGNIPISVPWDNKQLKISYETFRDKLLPGAKEEWKLKVSGSNGSRVAAEMLVSMYDASLDAFRPHAWPSLNLYPLLVDRANWNGTGSFSLVYALSYFRWKHAGSPLYKKTYDQLNWFGYLNGVYQYFAPAPALSRGIAETASVNRKAALADTVALNQSASTQESLPVQVRQNMQETAFFYPQLETDGSGNVTFRFTMPEALTRWKFMAFTHTKDLDYGYAEKEVVTQKQLMVMPNPPRFLREGDQVNFSTKIINLSGKPLTGEVTLQLLDPETEQPVNGLFKNNLPVRRFSADSGQSAAVSWPLSIPSPYPHALVWRIVAMAGDYSDGETNVLPVLTNKILITETLPLPIQGSVVKPFRFEKLLHSGESKTLQNYGLTVEFTTNPAWYAVQALPALSEAANGCSEQLFNRYYANALAFHIAHSSPEIEKLFEQWRSADTSELQSNLEKNQELKSVLLRETPWVLQAKTETEQKHRIAQLFDSVKMEDAITAALQQLEPMQTPNGGFAWFAGMPDNRYITQYIIAGIGHLRHLQVSNALNNPAIGRIVDKALPYLDARLKEDYEGLLKRKAKMDKDNLQNIQVQYLYMRSFFNDRPIAEDARTAYQYYLQQAEKYWLNRNAYLQAMITLALSRNGHQQAAAAILRSLKEMAIRDEETGMHWKNMTGGYYWYQAPVEAASLLVEAFGEAGHDAVAADGIRTWLLKQKQTQSWATTRATADAVYALLLTGNNRLAQHPSVTVILGKETIHSTDEKTAAGTGYFQKHFDGRQVRPDMGNISVKITPQAGESPEGQPSVGTAWGAVYWQYFEQVDKITSAATPLTIQKQLFVEKNTDRGPVLVPVTTVSSLKVGDKVKIRIELRAGRDMEFVHLEDMHAACFEPISVLSGYRWQGGTGYYQTAKDASTDFFFDRLPKGTYVFEYAQFVTAKGDYSDGISTVQCLYAPEFSSHTEGARIKVQ